MTSKEDDDKTLLVEKSSMVHRLLILLQLADNIDLFLDVIESKC